MLAQLPIQFPAALGRLGHDLVQGPASIKTLLEHCLVDLEFSRPSRDGKGFFAPGNQSHWLMSVLIQFLPQLWRNCECVIHRPSGGETFLKKLWTHLPFFGPRSQAFGLASPANKLRLALISHLGFPIGPNAIFRFVVSIIVDAVKSCAWWPFAHVGEERCERIAPPVAHLNSTTTIVAVSDICFTIAPRFCGHPRVVFNRYPVTCLSVRGVSQAENLSLKTATGSALSRPKRPSINDYDFFRVRGTDAIPKATLGIRNNGPSAKVHSGQVYEIMGYLHFEGQNTSLAVMLARQMATPIEVLKGIFCRVAFASPNALRLPILGEIST